MNYVKVALEEAGFMILDLSVLLGPTVQVVIQLHHLVGPSAILVVGGFLPNPQVHVVVELAILFVGTQHDVRVASCRMCRCSRLAKASSLKSIHLPDLKSWLLACTDPRLFGLARLLIAAAPPPTGKGTAHSKKRLLGGNCR